MSKSARSKKRRRAKRGDHVAPSAIALQARLRSGAGKHTNRTPRSTERRAAIQEQS